MALSISSVKWLTQRFQALGTPERAEWEKRYLKSDLKFHGVTVPVLRQCCAELLREQPIKTREQLLAAVEPLTETGFHDLRAAGLVLLERKRKLLTAADLPWLIQLVRTFANWAHVDLLATKVIGHVVKENPATLRQLRVWARDDSFWVRRTALLAQHDVLKAGAGDFELFEELAVPMLPEKEFFIRKALGWVLREVCKKRPALTYEFVRRHRAELSGLTYREATRCLPPAMRRQLE